MLPFSFWTIMLYDVVSTKVFRAMSCSTNKYVLNRLTSKYNRIREVYIFLYVQLIFFQKKEL